MKPFAAIWKAITTAYQQYPAISGYLVSLAVVIGTKYGLHLDANQVIIVAGWVATVITAYIHSSVTPVKSRKQRAP